MDIFQKAAKRGIRVKADQGNLSVEQLYKLKLASLDNLAVSLDKKIESTGGSSYIGTKTQENSDLTLQRDLVVAIIQDKLRDQNAAAKRQETIQKRELISNIIAKKEVSDLENKSKEELLQLLQETN